MPWEKQSLSSLVAQLSSPHFRYQKTKRIIGYESYLLLKKMNSSVKKGGAYKSIIWIIPRFTTSFPLMGSKNFAGYIFNGHVIFYLWIVTTGVEQFNHFAGDCYYIVQKRKWTRMSNAKSSGCCRKLSWWYFPLKKQLQKSKCYKIRR